MKTYIVPQVELTDISLYAPLADGFEIHGSQTVQQGGQWTRQKGGSDQGYSKKLWDDLK